MKTLIQTILSRLLVILTFLVPISVFSQSSITVVDGNAEGLDLPIDCYYRYSYSEQIYLQSEINSAGSISAIEFEWNGNESFTQDIKVYMGHTVKSEFATTSDWITSSSLSLVYDGSLVVTANEGWVSITLDTPFNYNNSDNLVIAVDENTSDFQSVSSQFYTLNVADWRSLVISSDNTNPDPSSPSSGIIQKYVASLKLTIQNDPIKATTVADGDFSDINTWDCVCVPGLQDSVIINHDLSLNENLSFDANSYFSIANGKVLTIGNTYSVSTAGEFLNNGYFQGSLLLNGSSQQNSRLGDIHSVSINNSAGVNVDGNTTIRKALNLNDGALDISGNDLKLASTDTSSSILTQDNGTLSGELTIEQFVSEATFGHHYLSTPMTNSSLTQLSDNFALGLSNNNPHIFFYNESVSSWQSPVSENETMQLGKGYTGYFRGEILVDIKGTPNNGITNVTVTGEDSGWNFIGNPYPSPIDWDSVQIPAGMSPAFYVWDHDHETWGKYASYLDGVSTNGGSNVIPTMQAFFVNTTQEEIIQFTNSCRISNGDNVGTFLKRASQNIPLVRLELSDEIGQTETVIRFRDQATIDYDIQLDALLLSTGNEEGIEFGSKSEDLENLVINSLPDFDNTQVIDLYSRTGQSKQFAIKIIEELNTQQFASIQLYDKQLDLYHDLKSGGYNFLGDKSDSETRFELLISKESSISGISTNENEEFNIYIADSKLQIQQLYPGENINSLSVDNVLGQNIIRKTFLSESGDIEVDLNDVVKNTVYIVKINNIKSIKILAQ